MQFLRVLNPVWNISLFHYRQSGNRASTILLGLQVRIHVVSANLAFIRGQADQHTLHRAPTATHCIGVYRYHRDKCKCS